MNHKFNRKDILSFDPTNASAEEIRKWLFAIIDAELDKAPKDRDYDLIAECSEFEAELPGSGIELSESEYVAGLERIMAQTPATEHKVTKILEPKKKTKKTVRIVAILAASIAALMLSLTVAASVQGKSVVQFIADSFKTILSIDAGNKIVDERITLAKYGKSNKYNSLEDAVMATEYDILYPSYLPNGIIIERIVITDVDSKGSIFISYVSNYSDFSITIDTNVDSTHTDWDESIIYKDSIVDFYIVKKSNGSCQAVGVYNDMRYSIKYNNYDELINILNGMKEIKNEN